MLGRRVMLALGAVVALACSGCANAPPDPPAPATPAPSALPTTPAPPAPPAGPVAEGTSQRIGITVGDRERAFILSVPRATPPEHDWPVVLAFHGWRESAAQLQRVTGLDAATALVAYPEGVSGAWSPAPYASTTVAEDIGFVAAVIDWIKQHYLVDDEHITAVGHSNGGGFVALLGCRIPAEIAAVATVSAAYYEDVHRDCAATPIPHLDIHGTADEVVEYYGGTRHETFYHSVADVLNAAAERNGCAEGSEIRRASTEVLEFRWRDCAARLEHIRVGGGQHVWPGGRADADREVPEDFATHRVLEFFGIGWRVP